MSPQKQKIIINRLYTIPKLIISTDTIDEPKWEKEYLLFKVSDRRFNQSVVIARLFFPGKNHQSIKTATWAEIVSHYNGHSQYAIHHVDLKAQGSGTIIKQSESIKLTGRTDEYICNNVTPELLQKIFFEA